MRTTTRRGFLRDGAAAGTLLILNSKSLRAAPANEKLNIALIGVGGRGSWFVDSMPGFGTRFAALCDVREDRLAKVGEKFPDAARFTDFRQMLEESRDKIDGVVVAAPDHIHAVASAKAMRLGKPVFCEKPLTRTIEEARALRDLAQSTKLATQMGNQGTSSDAFRRAVEIIQSGALGDIREIIAWNEGGGGGPHPRPNLEQPIPAGFHWDLYLGPREPRAFHQDWIQWHRWRDFATGQLGNWAVHTTNVAFKAFNLPQLWNKNLPDAQFPNGRKIRVTAKVSELVTETFPKWELIHFEAPPRPGQPAFKMTWGNRAPEVRERAETILNRKLDWGDAGEKKWKDYAGILVHGSRGTMHSTGHNMSFTISPEADFKELLGPPRKLPRSPGHENEWLRAIRGGEPACSNFVDYGSLQTEFLLLGNIATQLSGSIEYDPLSGLITNNEAANKLSRANLRQGWTL
jgi:predicted dehydrogenase